MSYSFSIKDAAEYAKKRVGIEGWELTSWEAVNGGSLIEGCVPDGVYQLGKKKGKPRLSHPVPGTFRKVIISENELHAEAKKYEKESKKCWNCKGKGKVFKSWHHLDGTKYAECKRCSGSGQATSQIFKESI